MTVYECCGQWSFEFVSGDCTWTFGFLECDTLGTD